MDFIWLQITTKLPCHRVNFFAENLSHAINTSKFSWALLFSLSRKTCWCKWGLKSQYFRRLLFFHFSKGGSPLSRNFYVRTRVKFMCVNKIEAMYERLRLNVRAEGGSTVAFQYARLFVYCLDFIYTPEDVKITRKWKFNLRTLFHDAYAMFLFFF